MPDISGSVGRGGQNDRDDVFTVQTLINAHLSVPLAPIEVDGHVGPHTIFAIEDFQRRRVGMNPPDGRVDPNGKTLRALNGSIAPVVPTPTPVTPPGTPSDPAGGSIAPAVQRPGAMRETAWRYLLQFTAKHEGKVLHMYNNKATEAAKQDVTCGIGFLLDPRDVVTQAQWIQMFYDPATDQKPTPKQMLDDWDAAAGLLRTGTNLSQYGVICKMRMRVAAVYDKMALILRDQKLPALLSCCKGCYKDFSSFPAAAQVFCLSFAYGRIPFDFPTMNGFVKDQEWAKAATQCHVKGMSALKDKGHKRLLAFAQQTKDSGSDFDQVPAEIF